MRAFLLLTRVQVLGLVNSLAPVRSGLSRSQRRGRIALIACGFALLAIIMMGYLAIMAFGLAVLGLARVLPALAVALGSLAGVVLRSSRQTGRSLDSKTTTSSCPSPSRAARWLRRAWRR